ncbi:hypothetical protein [Nocardia sp. NBC_01329]|uniref:hypothetical protein n=1 Tax=Nocardia sp. NBC_01329 TaxID=2903594 RepID=UPI002E14A3AB|nr:hypothetical protein OG405_15965 [Nocardia sp. NBC_01329]
MSTVRILLLLAGLALAGYGFTLLADLGPTTFREVALWALVAIVLHDAVFAPLCAAAGYTARRIVPVTWWCLLTCGAVCTVALVSVALPVLLSPASGNASLLDRNYPVGLAAAIVITWGVLLCGHLLARRR